jgi:hypothetical protein
VIFGRMFSGDTSADLLTRSLLEVPGLLNTR